MLKYIFSALVISLLLLATSAIGIQTMEDPAKGKTTTNKNFLIFTLVFAVIGTLVSLLGAFKMLKA